jgi:hypothetical protein
MHASGKTLFWRQGGMSSDAPRANGAKRPAERRSAEISPPPPRRNKVSPLKCVLKPSVWARGNGSERQKGAKRPAGQRPAKRWRRRPPANSVSRRELVRKKDIGLAHSPAATCPVYRRLGPSLPRALRCRSIVTRTRGVNAGFVSNLQSRERLGDLRAQAAGILKSPLRFISSF